MTAAVYKITILDTGGFYLGSSKNVEARYLAHLYKLRKKKHSSQYKEYCYYVV